MVKRRFRTVRAVDVPIIEWPGERTLLEGLRQSGVRLASILRYTRSYHIWHPRDVTARSNWNDNPNVQYFLKPGKPTRCVNGLVKPETTRRRAG